MGNSQFEPPPGRGSATVVSSRVYVVTKGVSVAPPGGFGPEYGIDSIGSYWFYCNASNVFVQECPFCTTDLSHVTVFRTCFPAGAGSNSTHRHRACIFCW